jgi:hypothetical protein
LITAFLAAPATRWVGIGAAMLEIAFAVERWVRPADMKWRAHVLPPLVFAVACITVAAQPGYADHGVLLVGLVAYTGYLVYRLGDLMPVTLHGWLNLARGRVAKWRLGRSLLSLLTRPWRRMWGLTSAWLVAIVALALISPTPWQLLASIVCGIAIVWLRRAWDHESLPAFLAPAAVCWVALLMSIADFTLRWAIPANPDLVTQLVASQLVLAVIPVTIAAAGMQFAVQWIGLRGLGVVPYGWIAATLVTLVLSLSADILAVSGTQYDTRGTEYLQVVALAELGAASLLIALIVRRMEPETVTTRLAGSLTNDWAQQVVGASQAFGTFFRPLYRDRFNVLERVLYRSAVLEGEAELFRDALTAVSRRLIELRPISKGWVDPLLGVDLEFEVAADVYFSNRLAPLIDEACTRHMAWPLAELVRFREQWSGRRLESAAHGNQSIVDAEGRFAALHGDLPAGMRLCSTVLDRSLEAGMDWPCSEGLAAAARYVRRSVNTLPDADSVSMLNEGDAVKSTFDGDAAANGIEAWVGLLEGVGVVAAAKDMNRVAWRAAGYLGDLVRDATGIEDPRWARFLASSALGALVRVVREGSKGGTNLMSATLPSGLDWTTPSGAVVLERLVAFFPGLVEATEPSITASTATSLAMLAQDVARTDSAAGGRLAASLDKVRQRNPEPDWELPGATQGQRISQIRQAAVSRDDFDRAFKEAGGIPGDDWEANARPHPKRRVRRAGRKSAEVGDAG